MKNWGILLIFGMIILALLNAVGNHFENLKSCRNHFQFREQQRAEYAQIKSAVVAKGEVLAPAEVKVLTHLYISARSNFGIQLPELGLETNILSLIETDSLGHMEFLFDLEDDFGELFPDDVAENLVTIGDYLEFVIDAAVYVEDQQGRLSGPIWNVGSKANGATDAPIGFTVLRDCAPIR